MFYLYFQDGKALNINHKEPNVAEVVIPTDFLSKLHLGRCSYSFKGKCTAPGALFTDFNVWSQALSLDKMKVMTENLSAYSLGNKTKMRDLSL